MNFPGTQHHKLNYVRPKEIFRSESDPVLPSVAGLVVVKSSWQEIGCRGNEARTYCASDGRFGIIPHVCSYEVVGEHHEAASNILLLPRQEDIAKHHWPVFGGDTPAEPNLRTLWVTVFGVEGQSLVKAKSPRQLSRTLVHSTLGVFIVMFHRSYLTYASTIQGGCHYICLGTCTGTSVFGMFS